MLAWTVLAGNRAGTRGAFVTGPPPVPASRRGGRDIQRYARLARPRQLGGCSPPRAAGLGLYPHSGRLCRPPAGLARRRAAVPPRRSVPGILPPWASSGKGQAGRRCRPCPPGPSGAARPAPGSPPWPPLPSPRPGVAAPCPCGRSPRRVGLGLRVLRPRLLPPGGRKVAPAAVPPSLPGTLRVPPAKRSRSRARKSTRVTHTRIYALFEGGTDQVHYFR